jgi:hypothetical protein
MKNKPKQGQPYHPASHEREKGKTTRMKVRGDNGRVAEKQQYTKLEGVEAGKNRALKPTRTTTHVHDDREEDR